MAASVAKGDLSLSIDEDELEASLSFTPDAANGAEWTAEKLLRVLMDARIGGFNPKKAEELVQKLGRARGQLKEIVAAGIAPERPQSEQPEWSELAMPPEYATLAQDLLAEAPPPILYKVKVENVKVEKTIKKPAALPFLAPKIEKVTTTERRESREQVFPDTTVMRTGWAKKGERIGILSQSKPGKPGKTIFGKPLQPEAEDGVFYAGPGVMRNKNELLADWDGVVRIGERWVDVVQLPLHTWSVERSPDGATFFLNYAPGDPRIPGPAAAQVIAKATELGAPADAIIAEEEVAAALAQAVSSKEGLFSFSLSQDRDAKATVEISPDGVVATLSVWKGRGRGRPLELSMVSAALKESRVRGFKPDELKKAVIDFYKSQDSELVGYKLAEGKAPGRGKDRVLSLAVGAMPEEKAAEMRKRLAEHPGLAQAVPSLADFPIEEATKIAAVQLGQKIGEMPASGAGADGVDVFGKALPGIPGNDPAVKAYENIDFGREKLVATATGMLLADERNKAWRLRVVKMRDASIEVSIAPDSMSASVSLSAEEGLGAPLAVEAVLAALAAKGVAQGVEPYAVGEAVANARAGKPVLKQVVARGKAARPGGSVKVTWIARKASGALYTLHDGDRADFRERDTMTRVSAEEPILKVERAADSGEDGFDVLGRQVKAAASAGGDAVPEHDASIREEKQEDGSTLFVAAVGGELIVEGLFGSGGRVSIRERYATQGDVGPETGNVKFPGTVQVAGSVRSGYTLVAGGDVTVTGAVEASLVSSDGTVRVAEGIKGARRGTIRARVGIEAAFAEQALLLAVEDVKLKTGCVLCNVKTNGRLVVLGEKGSLIGGLCRARKGVDVAVLGSENFAKTEISFGQDYLVADQIEAEEREIEKLKALILQSDRTMADLEKAGAGLDRIRQDKVKLLKLLEKRTHRVFDLREKFETHVASEVRVRGTVYPGVILESHNRFYEVRSKKTKVVFSFDQALGRVVERPL
jgi:Predicted polymerase, most proteins contain PALM domain, HD hydrolase domain and Zn-ribbon domain